jgi:uncharacterized membrane protein
MHTPTAHSRAARVEFALEKWAWRLFLIWTLVGFIVMPLEIGEAQMREWFPSALLQDAAVRFLKMSDAVWLVLAAMNTYFCLVAAEGIATARRWSFLILLSSAALEAVGAMTGFPFGPYAYTDNMGVRIAGVLPFTIPLAWLVIVITARFSVLRVFPNANRWQLAFGIASLALVTDWNLEFVAWKVRAYWIWYPQDLEPPTSPPWQNYATWFAAAFLLSLALGEGRMAGLRRPSWKPVFILGLINALFLCVRLARLWV